jgi:hypothetical protein
MTAKPSTSLVSAGDAAVMVDSEPEKGPAVKVMGYCVGDEATWRENQVDLQVLTPSHVPSTKVNLGCLRVNHSQTVCAQEDRLIVCGHGSG